MHRSRLAGPALVVVLAAVAFSVMAFTARSSSATESASTNPGGEVQAGATLFVAHCSSCHGPNGVGSQKAPELINAGAAAADLFLRTGRMPLNYPGQQALNHRPYFNDAQIRALDAYIAALPQINNRPNYTGPGIPTVAPVCPSDTRGGTGNVASHYSGDYSFEGSGGQGGALGGKGPGPCTTLSEGLSLFSLNCAQCHDASGSGGMISHGNVVPTLKDANATLVAEAVRVGPEPMPIFGPQQLSDHQMSAIVNYVQYLRSPADAGGLAIAHFGPVPEGFVGIVVGLFILLIFTRLIGTRE